MKKVDRNMKTILSIPSKACYRLKNHLLPTDVDLEELAFVFASVTQNEDELKFKYREWFPIQPDGFSTRSSFHLQLTDEMRAGIIKKAHDLDCSIIELHSHIGPYPACFSPSDWCGFKEFVPHVLWRLKGKPYAAVVVTQSGFDALVWTNNSQKPKLLDELRIGKISMSPTNLSLSKRKYYEI